ncbi:circularly permuted type 2 ATP-grasp protein [Minwuia sp.]|uniref:circularly permuted type 2 ATP-grasp protein n=1 Tax=Minwuia sp. TaxID=2493630 RepID=UPI003A8E6AB8
MSDTVSDTGLSHGGGQGQWGSDFRLGYSPPPDVFDEMLGTGDEGLRPLWQDIADFLADLSEVDWQGRWERGRRAMRRQGISYTVYGADHDGGASWRLDPVPMVLRADEWSALSTALIQRATLLDLILRDLLGPQTLLSEGRIPPALVFGHPGFFRPTVNAEAADQQKLFFYAADMARGADGQWRVMMDRTESPTGFGYALANRTIMAQVFPELLRSMDVRPVSGFFASVLKGLQAAAPRGREDPRIVILTPGRHNETYFEHAFMARQLGCALVEADDMTVREDHVFLKTLQGLQQVDVIFRRMDTGFCDPLELRGDSSLGVPGLTQVARRGNVSIVNALGSGIVEQPALTPFLPGLARQMMDEELALPSVATWWCGQSAERQHVIDQLERLVVKPAFPPDPGEPVFGGQIDTKRRESLLRAIAERPESHVGQELMRLSTSPTWSNHGLEPRAVMLRMLLCWTPDGWTVMPGGMVRVAPERRGRVVSMQRGGGAKDVWIPGASGPAETPRKRPAASVPIRRNSTNLSSRAAESLYWFGRYLERATGMSRRIRGAIRNVDERLFPVATGDEKGVIHGVLGSGIFRLPEADTLSIEELVQHAGQVYLDPDNPSSLVNVADQMRSAADNLRYMMSGDTWLATTRVQDSIQAARRVAGRPGVLGDRIDDIVYALQSLNGSIQDTMPIGHGWRFHDLGRRLEMALQMIDLLAGTLLRPEAASPLILTTVLDIADCTATYRERYRDVTDMGAVLDLLICDDGHPRSVAHQLQQITRHVEQLSELRGPLPGEDRHVAIRTYAAVQLADARDLADRDEDGSRPRLEQLLEILLGHLPQLNDAVTSRYFSHVSGRGRQLGIGLNDTIEGIA